MKNQHTNQSFTRSSARLRKLFIFLIVLAALTAALLLSSPASADMDNPASLNAQFPHWQEKDNIIHTHNEADAGRVGSGPAYVDAGQPIIFGDEGSGPSLEFLNYLINHPTFDVTLKISGDLVVPEFSVKEYMQEPFITETQSGAAWRWDHDGDGPGDGDGDGIGDWAGPAVVFFRYPQPGLEPGTYYFTITTKYFDVVWPDTITVIVE